MRVVLTFDVEVWCNGWDTLDADFPQAFSRYVYGRSRAGEYALPRTLEILRRHALKAVFFVEPLFAARFGERYLQTVVALIREADQEVQFHLHPEWADEIVPSPLPDIPGKRQHLCYYSLDEQCRLIELGRNMLEQALGHPPTAFRAGSFAANRHTYIALAANGIWQDSSIDATRPYSLADMREFWDVCNTSVIHGVEAYPLTVFRDGFGRLRHAQLGACSTAELIQAMNDAHRLDWSHFVVLSHNFEMLKPRSSEPDRIAARRFEQFCAFLARNRDRYQVGSFGSTLPEAAAPVVPIRMPRLEAQTALPQTRMAATGRRYAEQALRRLGWV